MISPRSVLTQTPPTPTQVPNSFPCSTSAVAQRRIRAPLQREMCRCAAAPVRPWPQVSSEKSPPPSPKCLANTSRRLYRYPDNVFVAGFLGSPAMKPAGIRSRPISMVPCTSSKLSPAVGLVKRMSRSPWKLASNWARSATPTCLAKVGGLLSC